MGSEVDIGDLLALRIFPMRPPNFESVKRSRITEAKEHKITNSKLQYCGKFEGTRRKKIIHFIKRGRNGFLQDLTEKQVRYSQR